jgi:hypothetical protein
MTGLFTHLHRVELPTPLLWWYSACTGPAPSQLPFYPLWAPFLFFPCFVGFLLFPIFPVCVCFQVLCRQSSPCLFTTHRPLVGLFPRLHCNKLPMPLPFSIPGLCMIGVCFFYFLIYFPVLLPSFGCICGFSVIFPVLFYFPILLACNMALSSLTRILSPLGFLVWPLCCGCDRYLDIRVEEEEFQHGSFSAFKVKE